VKNSTVLLCLLFLFCLTTSFQCQWCGTGTLEIGSSRSWLPLKGKTQLLLLDSTGAASTFRLRVVDTTETGTNDCGDPYKYEYIHTSLYLNPGQTDSIHFSLASSGWLCMSAWSNGNPAITMCNVFGQTKEGTIAKKLSNYRVGNRTYAEAILLLSNPGYSNNIDSVVIANKAGIVGFRYGGVRYFLP